MQRQLQRNARQPPSTGKQPPSSEQGNQPWYIRSIVDTEESHGVVFCMNFYMWLLEVSYYVCLDVHNIECGLQAAAAAHTSTRTTPIITTNAEENLNIDESNKTRNATRERRCVFTPVKPKRSTYQTLDNNLTRQNKQHSTSPTKEILLFKYVIFISVV